MDVESNRSELHEEVRPMVDFLADLTITKQYQETAATATDGAAEEGRWIVEGYASTSDLDSQDHVITNAALQQGAESLKKYQTLLFNHDPNRPIGYVQMAQATDGKLPAVTAATIARPTSTVSFDVRAPICAGDTLTGKCELVAIEEKHGPRPFTLLTCETQLSNQAGDTVLVIQDTTLEFHQ